MGGQWWTGRGYLGMRLPAPAPACPGLRARPFIPARTQAGPAIWGGPGQVALAVYSDSGCPKPLALTGLAGRQLYS